MVAKYLELSVKLRLVRHAEQTVLKVEFERDALRDWCLGLCLLKEGLIDTLIVVERKAKGKLQLGVAGGAEDQIIADVQFHGLSSLLNLTMRELDYVLDFFLKYYRDGIGEVDHIDLDARAGANEATITFKIPEAVNPISADEVRKRIGLD